ncbi:MAG: oligosaccharide flippase family protein [Syntrophomonadaceae bacterium]|nr:oligosaccharide flippase family protein [Syntrophomonadaceae bacterium]
MLDILQTKLHSLLPRGLFARNVLTLVSGTSLAQIITILASPIITRQYTPEDVGVFALYLAILQFITIVVNWRYEVSIVLPAADREAVNLLVLSLFIGLFMSLAGGLTVAVCGSGISHILTAPALAHWLWFMPLSLLAISVYQSLDAWNLRRQYFKRLAARAVTQSTITAATQITVGQIWHPGPPGLIGGGILGQSAAAARLAWLFFQDEKQLLKEEVNKGEIKRLAREYRRYPFYSSWSGLMNTASVLIPNFILGIFFTPAVVGFYALGQRILFAPMDLVGQAIFKVLFPQAIQLEQENKLQDFARDIFSNLVNLTLTPIFIIALLAPIMFEVVFGPGWMVAGEYTRWLCIWAVFRFIISPLFVLYDVYGKQKQAMFLNGILFILRLAALLIGASTGDPLLTIALFAGASALMHLFIGLYLFHLCHLSPAAFFIPLLQGFLQALPYLVPIILSMLLLPNELAQLAVALVIILAFLFFKRKIISNLGEIDTEGS